MGLNQTKKQNRGPHLAEFEALPSFTQQLLWPIGLSWRFGTGAMDLMRKAPKATPPIKRRMDLIHLTSAA